MSNKSSESGNVILFVLMAIVLIGLVTAAIRSGGLDGANINREQAMMNASNIRQYAGELERAVRLALSNGGSELDLRFAHADAPAEYGNDNTLTPQFQIFGSEGGGAEYQVPASGVNDGSDWEFFGNSALPGVGSNRADLVALLPNIDEKICSQLNEMNDYAPGVALEDPGAPGTAACIYADAASRFSNADGLPNTADDFAPAPNVLPAGVAPNAFLMPAMEACVVCNDGAGGLTRHYYRVLIAR